MLEGRNGRLAVVFCDPQKMGNDICWLFFWYFWYHHAGTDRRSWSLTRQECQVLENYARNYLCRVAVKLSTAGTFIELLVCNVRVCVCVCVCVFMYVRACVRPCVCVCVCLSLASDPSGTAEVIITKLGTVLSDVIVTFLSPILRICTITFITAVKISLVWCQISNKIGH